MKFNLAELEDLFEKIKNVLSEYEAYKYSNKSNTLYLANGEQINYTIRKDSVPHLLGIDTTYLISTDLFKSKSSYELLNELIENPYKIWTNFTKGIISFDRLFSKFIDKKVDSFLDNIRMKISDIEAICCYSKERSYHLEDKIENCDYIVIKSHDNDKIGILTFVKNGIYCLPMSNRIYDNFESAREDLSHMLNNQVITIATGIRTYDKVDDPYKENMKNFNLFAQNQIPKIENLKYYADEFNATPNTISQHIYNLKKQSENYEDKIDEDNIIDYIAKSILEGKPITTSNDDTRLTKIINAYNDSLYSDISRTEDFTYTQQKNRIKELEQELTELRNLKENLILTNTFLKEENEVLKNDVNEKSIKLQKVYEIIKPSE